MTENKKGFIHLLQEFSIPLIAGVFAGLIAANVAPDWYVYVFGGSHGDPHWELPGHLTIFGHHITPYFLINDIFMVFFFGIAAKEITEAALPGGSLNPPRKAINPLFATAGGVLGPVGVFFGALYLSMQAGLFPEEYTWAELQRGWGIPTATDIALAWLVARAVFGKGHPAINFLLLLAVADDAIGLGIIAIFYGDPRNPAEPVWLLLILTGMALAYGLRRMNVQSWVPYIFLAGPLSWCGLILAHLHPALALVFIVPFLPGPRRDTGMYSDEDEVDRMGDATAHDLGLDHSPLHNFEHQLKGFVDFGLFFFAMGNAGVQVGGMGTMTWIILGSLIVGKTVGIGIFAWFAKLIGFPLPDRMGAREVMMAGFVAALGLTVALFVSGAAFPDDLYLQGQAKMGALLSGGVGVAAIVLGRAMGMGRAVPAGSGDGSKEGAPGAAPPARESGGPDLHADSVPGALPAGARAQERSPTTGDPT
jgi:NhaA family Na+:H+ antiporter